MEIKTRKIFALILCIVLTVCVFPIQMAREAKAQVTVIEEWVARYDGLGGTSDMAYAMALDSQGSVYVTGSSFSEETNTDFATVKYDSNGNELWVAIYNSPNNRQDRAVDVAVDASDNVYVTGSVWDNETQYDYATIKYDTDGNQQWLAISNGSGFDQPSSMAVNTLGHIVVTGNRATVVFDQLGNELWTADTFGSENTSASFTDCACASNGNTFVTGWCYRGLAGYRFDYDIVTVAYDYMGNELWYAMYNGPGNGEDQEPSIALDASGYVYVAGASWGGTGTQYDYVTIKYDDDGNELWVRRYDGPGRGYDHTRDIALDPWGSVYVTGSSKGNGTWSDYATVKYDSEGNEQWVSRYAHLTACHDWAWALAVDDYGNAYVTGWSDDDEYSSYIPEGYGDYATVAYDSQGNELWVARYGTPGTFQDWAYDIVVDDSCNVYVTGAGHRGASGFDFTTIKYSQQFPIQATIDIDPDTLNLKSKGKWITAYITLPEGYDVNDIDISTILLEETIPAEWGDIQGDVLMVKFDRSEVEDYIGSAAEEFTLTVTGELYDGTEIQGSDTIRVINPPEKSAEKTI